MNEKINLMCPCRCGSLQAHIEEKATGTGTHTAAVHCAQCKKLIKILTNEINIIKSSKEANSRTKSVRRGSRRGTTGSDNDAKKFDCSSRSGSTRTRASRIMAHDDASDAGVSGSAAAHTMGDTAVLAVKRLQKFVQRGDLTSAIALLESSGHTDSITQHFIITACQPRTVEVGHA